MITILLVVVVWMVVYKLIKCETFHQPISRNEKLFNILFTTFVAGMSIPFVIGISTQVFEVKCSEEVFSTPICSAYSKQGKNGPIQLTYMETGTGKVKTISIARSEYRVELGPERCGTRTDLILSGTHRAYRVPFFVTIPSLRYDKYTDICVRIAGTTQ